MIVATAGPVDHGKTSLIKALAGTDTDRLAEEKKRGARERVLCRQIRLRERVEPVDGGKEQELMLYVGVRCSTHQYSEESGGCEPRA